MFYCIVMLGMKGFHVSASRAIQGHHGPLVMLEKQQSCRAHKIMDRCTGGCGITGLMLKTLSGIQKEQNMVLRSNADIRFKRNLN